MSTFVPESPSMHNKLLRIEEKQFFSLLSSFLERVQVFFSLFQKLDSREKFAFIGLFQKKSTPIVGSGFEVKRAKILRALSFQGLDFTKKIIGLLGWWLSSYSKCQMTTRAMVSIPAAKNAFSKELVIRLSFGDSALRWDICFTIVLSYLGQWLAFIRIIDTILCIQK